MSKTAVSQNAHKSTQDFGKVLIQAMCASSIRVMSALLSMCWSLVEYDTTGMGMPCIRVFWESHTGSGTLAKTTNSLNTYTFSTSYAERRGKKSWGEEGMGTNSHDMHSLA